MAIITNISSGAFPLLDLSMGRYELQPGQSVTISNSLLNPFLISDAETKNLISLKGWAPDYAGIDDLNLPQQFIYNTDGTISYVTLASGDKLWRQTFTYVNGQLVQVSSWALYDGDPTPTPSDNTMDFSNPTNSGLMAVFF